MKNKSQNRLLLLAISFPLLFIILSCETNSPQTLIAPISTDTTVIYSSLSGNIAVEAIEEFLPEYLGVSDSVIEAINLFESLNVLNLPLPTSLLSLLPEGLESYEEMILDIQRIISDVEVELIPEDALLSSNEFYSALTDSLGMFHFDSVPVGLYKLKATIFIPLINDTCDTCGVALPWDPGIPTLPVLMKTADIEDEGSYITFFANNIIVLKDSSSTFSLSKNHLVRTVAMATASENDSIELQYKTRKTWHTSLNSDISESRNLISLSVDYYGNIYTIDNQSGKRYLRRNRYNYSKNEIDYVTRATIKEYETNMVGIKNYQEYIDHCSTIRRESGNKYVYASVRPEEGDYGEKTSIWNYGKLSLDHLSNLKTSYSEADFLGIGGEKFKSAKYTATTPHSIMCLGDRYDDYLMIMDLRYPSDNNCRVRAFKTSWSGEDIAGMAASEYHFYILAKGKTSNKWKAFKYTTAGKYVRTIGEYDYSPEGIATDNDGNVYISNYNNIYVYSSTGKRISKIELPDTPKEIAIDGFDYLYALCEYKDKICRLRVYKIMGTSHHPHQ